MTAATRMPSAQPATLADVTSSLNAWIEVDLAAVEHNVATLRQTVGAACEIIAVIKANAYGAGMAGLIPALEAAGVARFAVVWAAEGVQARAAGATKPIIVLGHAFPDDAANAVQHDLTLTCHTLELGQALSGAAAAQGKPARVHVKVDTGLHRFGVGPEDAIALAESLRQLPGLDVEGLTTHMANADEADDSFSDIQRDRFAAVAAALPWIRYRHTANSATALRRGDLRYDGVRTGLALHGIDPANTPDPGLRPILSLKARVARVVDVPAGDGVSYGLRWRAGRDSRVALVPVGYGDGWRRSLGNTGHVLVNGQRRQMAGTLCMDQFLADVTDAGDVREGDEVVLLGAQGSDRITAHEVAEAAGTIPWDVFASLQARLPRIYHRNGVVGPLRNTPS